MKKLLVELDHLPEAGKNYVGELDKEVFGIDDDEVLATGPLSFDLHVQRFEGELFIRGKISAPFQFRCVRCLEMFDYVVELVDYSTSIEIEQQLVIDLTDALREEIVLEFPAYPRCSDSDEENDCMPKSSDFRVDKEGGLGVKDSAPSSGSSVWDALDQLGN